MSGTVHYGLGELNLENRGTIILENEVSFELASKESIFR